ncbi:hypothetical protein DFR68_110284 [Nocardia mexicana]|uniref:Uncharacterized protein n=1 Tax=Nocardia mexicana TaxID=279262 RepID=A0A370GT50_9NOCA|nr:hypothetical protein DFR68_110284 [Nocardia mexicana]
MGNSSQLDMVFHSDVAVDWHCIGVSAKMNGRACWVNSALPRYGVDHNANGRFAEFSPNHPELGRSAPRSFADGIPRGHLRQQLMIS